MAVSIDTANCVKISTHNKKKKGSMFGAKRCSSARHTRPFLLMLGLTTWFQTTTLSTILSESVKGEQQYVTCPPIRWTHFKITATVFLMPDERESRDYGLDRISFRFPCLSKRPCAQDRFKQTMTCYDAFSSIKSLFAVWHSADLFTC